jgi:pyruvate/2-oxoglutarate dehydrogenase complex dihydrolipoamide dehydrogenase (E3) component
LDTRRLELSKVERAFIDGEEEGFAVLYTRKGPGEIVGATLVAMLRKDWATAKTTGTARVELEERAIRRWLVSI